MNGSFAIGYGPQVGGVVERFIYQDQLEPVAKVDGEGTVLELYVYAEKGHVPSYMVKGGTTYRVISDHLGSVRMVVDAQSGTIAQEITYDEFGIVLSDTNPGFQPFYFAGGVYDLDTKLVKFGARDYDPEVGRWIVGVSAMPTDTIRSMSLKNTARYSSPRCEAGSVTSRPKPAASRSGRTDSIS